MSVKLSSSLPTDDRNGLPALATPLIDNPSDVHVAVVLLSCKEIRSNQRTGSVVPTAEIVAVEPFTIETEDIKELQRLLRRQHERRTGKIELPLELEQALDDLTPADPDDDDDRPDETDYDEPDDESTDDAERDEPPW